MKTRAQWRFRAASTIKHTQAHIRRYGIIAAIIAIGTYLAQTNIRTLPNDDRVHKIYTMIAKLRT